MLKERPCVGNRALGARTCGVSKTSTCRKSQVSSYGTAKWKKLRPTRASSGSALWPNCLQMCDAGVTLVSAEVYRWCNDGKRWQAFENFESWHTS
jgi:hypothetical protein